MEFDANNATAKENLNRLTGNRKKIDLLLGNPQFPVDSWTAQMRELFKRHNEEIANGNYWAEHGSDDKQENCRALSGWWAGTHNANGFLTQLIALSRLEVEKQSLLEERDTKTEIETKALAQWRAAGCS